jgi:hypothetical protein
MVVSADALLELRKELEALAERFDGDYDGWESTVLEEEQAGWPAGRKPAPRLHSHLSRARSSVGERSPHTREVAGSKPAAPTSVNVD